MSFRIPGLFWEYIRGRYEFINYLERQSMAEPDDSKRAKIRRKIHKMHVYIAMAYREEGKRKYGKSRKKRGKKSKKDKARTGV